MYIGIVIKDERYLKVVENPDMERAGEAMDAYLAQNPDASMPALIKAERFVELWLYRQRGRGERDAS